MSGTDLVIYQSAALAPPLRRKGPGRLIWLSAAAVLAFLVWAGFAALDEIVRADGAVISSSRTQSIQSLEGGILSEVRVREGDVVEAGAILARLSDTAVRAEVEELSEQIAALDLRRLRLEAEAAGAGGFDVPPEIAGRHPDLVASELGMLAARLSDFRSRRDGAGAILAETDKERRVMQDLDRQNLVAKIEVTKAEKAYADAKKAYDEVVTGFELERATALGELLTELSTLRQTLAAREDTLLRTVLRAPMRGIVNKVDITTIGGVVGSGEQIIELIPLDETLLFEALVKPRDIASLRVGQEATIRLSAYDFAVYGLLHGKVEVVSADTFVDERARDDSAKPHYKVLVSVDMDNLTDRQRDIVLRPGMQGQAELFTGQKTVLRYLLKPLYRAREALTER